MTRRTDREGRTVIPAGSEAIAADDVARILGVSLGTLRNTKATSRPGFPAPLNPHRGRDQVWDRAEIEAYAAGRRIGPRRGPSPDDLLDDVEAAAVVGVSAETFAKQLGRIGAEPRRVPAHGLRYWRRGDLVTRHETPPGRRGKPQGATDLTPRRTRGGPSPAAVAAQPRIEEFAAYLARLGEAGREMPSTSALAERFGVSMQTVRRWLARVDQK